MPTPRIAALHDLSGFGRCSLTIVMPTLSAMGVQCCPLPTAYLSTHTGGFTGNTFLDLTSQMAPVTAHWKGLGLAFDAVYTGFMGSSGQIALAAEMCQAMAELAALADVIVPNRTEAALLLGVDYESLALDRETDCRRWAQALSLDGRRSVVLTGTSVSPGTAGAVCFDRATGRTEFACAPLVPGSFHGTGDLFASVLAGALVKGQPLAAAAQLAADFTSLCAKRTGEQNLPAREGLDFEPLLWQLGGGTDDKEGAEP